MEFHPGSTFCDSYTSISTDTDRRGTRTGRHGLGRRIDDIIQGIYHSTYNDASTRKQRQEYGSIGIQRESLSFQLELLERLNDGNNGDNTEL
jgi:hypothetical protein